MAQPSTLWTTSILLEEVMKGITDENLVYKSNEKNTVIIKTAYALTNEVNQRSAINRF